MAGPANPLTLDTDLGQTAPPTELIRATADGFLSPPLQHQGKVNTASFDATGERVVTASGTGPPASGDARTGEPIGETLQHPDMVRAASFEARGERVVTGSADQTPRIWDAHTGDRWAIRCDMRALCGRPRPSTPAGERILAAS